MPPRPMSDPQQQGMQQPQWRPQQPPNMMGNEGKHAFEFFSFDLIFSSLGDFVFIQFLM